jgi:hypothetical protein
VPSRMITPFGFGRGRTFVRPPGTFRVRQLSVISRSRKAVRPIHPTAEAVAPPTNSSGGRISVRRHISPSQLCKKLNPMRPFCSRRSARVSHSWECRSGLRSPHGWRPYNCSSPATSGLLASNFAPLLAGVRQRHGPEVLAHRCGGCAPGKLRLQMSGRSSRRVLQTVRMPTLPCRRQISLLADPGTILL